MICKVKLWADGGIFVRKWLLGLCLLLFLDTQTAGHLREKTSLQDLRDRGIPTRMLERLEIPAEEIRLYGIFWEDLQYFPAAGRKEVQGQQFFFENSWHARRTFQGERLHEGCDIFGREEKSGYYPILSMTDGIVEKVGWLPLGGYRIGIRSPGGGYFYYAHLSSYAREFQTGEQIKAGEVLGFLGDTGYGEEGTAGKFVPHLHLGIYVRTQTEEEHALNPYPVLQFLQKRQKNFFY
ncbi:MULTISPECIES: M23 family metallopeptidase [unclassified Blautia]|jgi:murein DD-endopeptidase MepM/ murein hydrolase activator NlpD|uniref:M23 family metallopeptidase n=1 Tax=unclassified Blautia TaxID=2648079 RepID=UPI0025C378A5|nr:M23 family metallopeptidase [Blautia sp.]MEE0642481.1 M23 family metallopeptidase [Blautia sp.]